MDNVIWGLKISALLDVLVWMFHASSFEAALRIEELVSEVSMCSGVVDSTSASGN
jgi:hypothetical protein